MEESSRTKSELLSEISILKQRNKELERLEANYKQAEAKLRESEEYARSLFTNSLTPLIVMDAKTGIYLDCNEAAVRVYGYATRENVLGKTPLDVSAPIQYNGLDSASEAKRHIQSGREKGSHIFEWRHQRTNGQIWDAKVHLMLFQYRGKSLIQFNLQDITERKIVEEALRQSEEKFRLLVENSHDIIYSLNADGVFTFVSSTWTELLGHPVTQVSGKPFQLFVPPEDIPLCMAFLKSVIETGQRKEGVEYRVKHANGTWRWHTSSAVPFKDESGVAGYYGIARDITERKKKDNDLKELLSRLQNAIEEIKTLRGIVPICANCKKIRDDKGYWNQVEKYVSDHTEATFSHSICPECAKKLYPGFYKENI
jgi:PAS domain S-box-containing protein